jgi:hypothetical protein
VTGVVGCAGVTGSLPGVGSVAGSLPGFPVPSFVAPLVPAVSFPVPFDSPFIALGSLGPSFDTGVAGFSALGSADGFCPSEPSLEEPQATSEPMSARVASDMNGASDTNRERLNFNIGIPFG